MALLRYSVDRTGDDLTDRNFDNIKRAIDSLVAAAGIMNTALVTLDFGAGATEASTIVRASWVTPSSVILAGLADDTRLDDALMEGIVVGVTGRGVGSFTVSGMAPAPVSGQYVAAVMGR